MIECFFAKSETVIWNNFTEDLVCTAKASFGVQQFLQSEGYYFFIKILIKKHMQWRKIKSLRSFLVVGKIFSK